MTKWVRRSEVSYNGWVLTGTAVLVPMVANFANKGVATLFTLCVAALLVRQVLVRARWIAPPREIWAPLLGLALVGLASALWALDPWLSFSKSFSVLGLALGAILLASSGLGLGKADREAVAAGLFLGVAVCVAIGSVAAGLREFVLFDLDFLTDSEKLWWWGKLQMSKAGISILIMLLWPMMMVLTTKGKGRWAGALYLLFLGVCLLASATTATVALLCAGAVWGFARVAGARRAILLVAVVSCVSIIGMPRITAVSDWRALTNFRADDWKAKLPYSMHHRLLIYGFTSEKIFERPLLGWGLEASRIVPGGKGTKSTYIISGPPDAEVRTPWVLGQLLMPLHPHNFALQWRMELGVPGVMAGLAVLLAVLWRISRGRIHETCRSLALSQYVTGVVISAASYGAWQAWWLSGIIISAVFAAVLARDDSQAPGMSTSE